MSAAAAVTTATAAAKVRSASTSAGMSAAAESAADFIRLFLVQPKPLAIRSKNCLRTGQAFLEYFDCFFYASTKVGNQDFYFGGGRLKADFLDAVGKMPGSPIS